MRWLVPLLVACSSSKAPPRKLPAEPPPKPAIAAVCADLRLGGYEGSPECKTAAATPIPGVDRSCTTNADCIRLGPHCAPFAIRTDRSDAYQTSPCIDPRSGQCPPPCAAVCQEGCCVIPPGWGDNCR